ncbi:hypothetical protein [Clostridium ihumii]|uniref:hypothetical protein n=1 Tax=Clostridium ihumii TaxID=1470356 RepID=UPI003D324F39
MNSKKIKKHLSIFFLLSTVSILSLTGCTTDTKNNSSVNKTNTSISLAANTNKNENTTELKNQIKTLEDKVNALTDELSKKEDANNNVKNDLYIPLYTANLNDYSSEILCYVKSTSTNIEDNLKLLCSKLSKITFNELPIELSSLETIEGKKVATINLSESLTDPNIPGIRWSQNYFQGSAGGEITSTTLINTFVQSDLDIDWIDGVKFLYNGKPIEFQHVSKLSQIHYK